MLQQNHDNIDNFWIIIKQVRKNYLSQNDDPECKNNQIAEDDIKTNIDNIEENLNTNSTNYDYYDENITEDILQTGAEMFTYVNFCPPKKLLQFYKELLLQGSTKDIILAVTNIMKTRRNAEKVTATKIWSKIEMKLKYLKYNGIDSVKLRLTDFPTCTEKTCSEKPIALGWN